MHLVGFVVEIYYDALLYERQNGISSLVPKNAP